ncbi:MAG: Thisulfide interchange protein [Candidatus Tokpelaia sp. JSC189]|nr:MAG: Thisulfide interchange protein [Candidatus Tokpelaia sp. JSC189]
MLTRIFAAGGNQFSHRQLDLRIRLILLMITLFAVYAIIDTISTAKEQGIAQCNIGPVQRETLHRAAKGFFTALRIVDKSYYAGDLIFHDSEGRDVKLTDFKGKTLLVNLWAIWCIPCQDEMSALAGLKRKWKASGFDVIAINVDRSPDKQIKNFLKEVDAADLAVYRDKSMKIFQALKREKLGFGLPVTMVVDRQGCVIAAFNGSAPWEDQTAVAFIEAAINIGR